MVFELRLRLLPSFCHITFKVHAFGNCWTAQFRLLARSITADSSLPILHPYEAQIIVADLCLCLTTLILYHVWIFIDTGLNTPVPVWPDRPPLSKPTQLIHLLLSWPVTIFGHPVAFFRYS